MDERESFPRSADSDRSCLSWDTFCDLLDGVPWDAVEPRLSLFRRATKSSGDSFLLREQFSIPGQYFFEENPSRRAHEIFWLKLSLFNTLCRQVAQLHLRTRRPLLTLDPTHVLLALPEQGSTVIPVRWGCTLTVQTSDEVPHLLFDEMPSEMASGLSAVP